MLYLFLQLTLTYSMLILFSFTGFLFRPAISCIAEIKVIKDSRIPHFFISVRVSTILVVTISYIYYVHLEMCMLVFWLSHLKSVEN